MARWAVLATVFALIAGCGGDDEADGQAPPDPSVQQGSEPLAPAELGSVTIEDFDFDPRRLRISVGEQVTWTNLDSANHNVIFDGDAVESIDNLRQNQKGSVTFEQAGTFEYVCSYHPGMEGSVVVQ